MAIYYVPYINFSCQNFSVEQSSFIIIFLLLFFRYGSLNGSFTGNMNNSEIAKTGKGNRKNTASSVTQSASSNAIEDAGKFKIKCPICQEIPNFATKSDGKSFRYFTKKTFIYITARGTEILKSPGQKTRKINFKKFVFEYFP